MRKSATILFILLFTNYALGQTETYLGFEEETTYLGYQTVEALEEDCNFAEIDSQDPAYEVVQQMVEQLGLSRVYFKISQCPNVNNARAQLITNENGQFEPYMVFDGEWLAQLSKNASTNWAAIGVLAHELGHFQQGHTINAGRSKPQWELEADRFMGYKLAELGATLEEAQSAISQTSVKGSSSHPPRAERMLAVQSGFFRYSQPKDRVILTQDTPDRSINSELILDRFTDSIGGAKTISRIRSIKFLENRSIEFMDSNRQSTTYDFLYHHQVFADSSLVSNKNLNENYKIVFGDSVRPSKMQWKFSDMVNWKEGIPPVGTGTRVDQNEHDFINSNLSPLNFFFEHQINSLQTNQLFFRNRRNVGNVECFIVEVPSKRFKVGNPPKNGKQVEITETQFYSSATGFLYAQEKREKVAYYKRGKFLEEITTIREYRYDEYQNFDEIQLPLKTRVTISKERNGFPVEGTITQLSSLEGVLVGTE